MHETDTDVRPWLRDIAIWFDGFRSNRPAKERLRKQLLKLGKASRRKILRKLHRYREEDFPLNRVANLSEKYELLAAIHRGMCKDTWRIEVRNPKVGFWEAKGASYADMRFYKWSLRLSEIRDEHFNQVLDAVHDVADDLGVKPLKLTLPATVQATIEVVNAGPPSVPVAERAPVGKGKPNGTTPKKPGGRKQTRKRAKRTIATERELQALELHSRRYSFAEIGKELGVSRERARQLVNSGSARQGPQGRSTNLSKAVELRRDYSSDKLPATKTRRQRVRIKDPEDDS